MIKGFGIFICCLSVVAISVNAFADRAGLMTPLNTSPEEVMQYVERGAVLITELGEDKAFPILTDSKGPWVDGQWYLFVNSFEGFVIAHLNQKLIGKTLLHIRDIKGNAFYAELQRIGQSEKGRGWAKYWWPRAGSKMPELKAGYILRVPGMQMWIGTGLYGLSEEEVDRLIAEYND